MSCPQGHTIPTFGCRWCNMAQRDTRYLTRWFGENAKTHQSGQRLNCVHLGESTGETVSCSSCRSKVELKLFNCAVYGQCTPTKSVPGVACCAGRVTQNGVIPCPHYSLETNVSKHKLKWAYGVTTVPSRRKDLLPRTLGSLKNAGFSKPHLFVDGDPNPESWRRQFGLEVTAREPKLQTFGNWVIGMWELYVLNPTADMYAMFQDDIILYTNLREYLEHCTYPDRGYWNLYTFPENDIILPKEGLDRPGIKEGWYESNQRGRGAVALIFNRQTLTTLISSQGMVEKPQHATKGWRNLDGAIINALKKAGYSEYVHSPSLVQHIGDVSSMRSKIHPKAISFRGEEYDARKMMEKVTT